METKHSRSQTNEIKSWNVVVAGATGYSGAELVRLLSRHPHVTDVRGVAGDNAGARLEDTCPASLAASMWRQERIVPVLASTAELVEGAFPCDALFLCLPHGAQEECERLVDWARTAGVIVIDVGDSLRAKALAGEGEAVYGLSEFFAPAIANSQVIANPGCYPTSVLLALGPLACRGLLDAGTPVIVDSKSGTTGAGRAAQKHLLLSEMAGNLVPYKIGRVHRHVAEMEAALKRLSPGSAPRIVFTPHLLPVSRGLLSTVYVRLNKPLGEAFVRETLCSHYADDPFVRILGAGKTASLAPVVNTPRAIVSVHGVEGDDHLFILVSALDNLLKGAASSAVQNFNHVIGCHPATALL